MSDITEPKDRAKRIGLIVGASFGIAFAFGPFIGGYIYHHHGGILSVGRFATALCVLNLLGVLFAKHIKAWLFHPVPVAIAFILGGLVILWVEGAASFWLDRKLGRRRG